MEPNNQMRSDEIEIDLVELIGVLVNRLWIIILSGILAGLLTFMLSVYVITPKYESTTKIYIINRQSSETLTCSDLQTGTQLTKDYQELVTSRPVLDEVRMELGLDIDNDDLKEKIKVEVPTDTRIVTITVEDAEPKLAQAMADAIRISASEHISAVMNTEAVNVVEEADLPLEPSSPKVIKNTVIGGVAGAFFAIAIIVLIYIMDDTIKNPDDVEHYLKVSVLGSIPYVDEKSTEDSDKSKKKKKKKKVDDDDDNERRKARVMRSGLEGKRNGY